MAAEARTAAAALQERLGHAFRAGGLLTQALTHRSCGSPHNERLEFLGDALLGMIISTELFSRFPDAPEGDLSRLRASLVRGRTIAEVARELRIGPCLRFSAGERQSGGSERESALADALEALVAAIYLDAGIEAAAAAVRRWFGARLERLDPSASHKDAKTELQELLQGRRAALPAYEVVSITGEGQAQEFHVVCRAAGLAAPVTGSGRSRRIAEQEAARAALAELRDRNTRHE